MEQEHYIYLTASKPFDKQAEDNILKMQTDMIAVTLKPIILIQFFEHSIQLNISHDI